MDSAWAYDLSSTPTHSTEAELQRLRRIKKKREESLVYNTSRARKRARREATKLAAKIVFRPKKNAKIPRGLDPSEDTATSTESEDRKMIGVEQVEDGGVEVREEEDVETTPDAQLRAEMGEQMDREAQAGRQEKPRHLMTRQARRNRRSSRRKARRHALQTAT